MAEANPPPSAFNGTLKIATYNVHNWNDAAGKDNMDRVVSLVSELQPDILCLQECAPFRKEKFRVQTGYRHSQHWAACSILTSQKFKGEEFINEEGKSYRPRLSGTTAQICLSDQLSFHISSMHLDYRLESTRLMEIDKIHKSLKTRLEKDAAQVWVGDFNAITRSDYSEEEWADVVRVRREGQWEAPVSKLTDLITNKLGFTDNWSRQGRPPPTTTCRFNTHIDYIYTNTNFDDLMTCTNIIHHPSTASDHKLVMATFESKTSTIS